jgi:hypothetical protein
MLRILVAIGLLWFVFFGSIPNIDIKPIPDKIDEVSSILDITQPSDEILSKVRPVAKLVTDTEDRAKIALFNYEFSQRVLKYDTDAQKLNDLYSKAGSNFFHGSLKGKYSGFADSLKVLFESVVGSDNHVLTTQEKQALKELFSGLSWALIEK